MKSFIHFENCKIEIIGSWIWISGNTKEYKEILKELKFKWCNKKSAWSYHNGKFYKKSSKKLSLEQLRNFFGSQEVKTEKILKIA